jgi:hypothetical protein
MAGHSRSKNGVFFQNAYVPAIPTKAGTLPA